MNLQSTQSSTVYNKTYKPAISPTNFISICSILSTGKALLASIFQRKYPMLHSTSQRKTRVLAVIDQLLWLRGTIFRLQKSKVLSFPGGVNSLSNCILAVSSFEPWTSWGKQNSHSHYLDSRISLKLTSVPDTRKGFKGDKGANLWRLCKATESDK